MVGPPSPSAGPVTAEPPPSGPPVPAPPRPALRSPRRPRPSRGTHGPDRGRPPAMRTRLTELLGIEHPVMLAGMGGVSYSALAVGRLGRRRLRMPGRRHHEQRDHGGRDIRRARGHRQALRRRPPHRHARQHEGAGPDHHRWRGNRVRGGPRGPHRGHRAVPPRQRARRQHVRQGGARRACRRCGLRPRRGPGDRGRRPHRPGGHDAPRPPDRRRRRRPRARRRRRRHLRRSRPGCGVGPRRRRRLGRHPLHRHARGSRGARATRRGCSPAARTRRP